MRMQGMLDDAARRRHVALALMAAPVCGLSACGSSSPDHGAGDATQAAGGGSSTAASDGKSVATPAGTASVGRVYAPGVPTLADLYRSTEQPPPKTAPP